MLKQKGENYTIPQVDLSVMPQGLDEELQYLFNYTTVDEGEGYLGHPDSVTVNGDEILTFYPEGHGKGRVILKKSVDGGRSYIDGIENAPESWANSKETPTVYRLQFSQHNWNDKIILICGNPKWWNEKTSVGGFNCSISCDEGKTFSEFELFFGGEIYPIVSMSSLTRLKENGEFVDKWMGLFHDKDFVNYKTILSFDDDGKMCWSKPVPYFSKYRKIEKESNMCEVECIRSDGGKGDELMLITRSNSKKVNSLLSFSTDEGETWSEPVFAPSSINGERHKADYLKDGRLFITFRSIERDKKKNRKYYEKRLWNWYSEGWIAWVGTYDDLKNGREGQYRIKVAHTYLPKQNKPVITANGDTGYCGNVVLSDGTVVTSSYGIFSTEEKLTGKYSTDKGKLKRKTFIVSKRIKLDDIERLITQGHTTPKEVLKKHKSKAKIFAILLAIIMVGCFASFIRTSYSLKGQMAQNKIGTKIIEELDLSDSLQTDYYYRYLAELIFVSESCVIKSKYDKDTYEIKKAEYSSRKFETEGPLFMVFGEDLEEYIFSNEPENAEMVLSETEFDINDWHFVTDKDSYLPKCIKFYGFNDKTNEIACVVFEDFDLDEISEPMKEFFDYYIKYKF